MFGKKRYSFEVDNNEEARIQEMARRLDIQPVDLFNHGLSMLQYSIDSADRGRELGFRSKDTNEFVAAPFEIIQKYKSKLENLGGQERAAADETQELSQLYRVDDDGVIHLNMQQPPKRER